MAKLLYQILISARPIQWLKNLALFAALVFSGNLLIASKLYEAIWAIVIFSILTSAIYIFNDIIDFQKDRLHPFKKLRPIASGALPVPFAFFIFVVLSFVALYFSLTLSFFFFLTCLSYLLLQITYSLILKSYVIFDVMVIAGGFILRVAAGAFVLGVHLSGWFYICVISLALFLAVGKRRSELAILAEKASSHRKTLSLYTAPLLDGYLSMFGAASFLSWALFTFFAPPPPVIQVFPVLTNLPLTLAGINKWLMATIPMVIYGIMRYEKIIYEGTRAESPEKVLLSDKPLLASALLWGLLVVGIIYGVQE
ncbi:MAG: decaprenyl-phosphate phosphoribosyltransferase [bacterium]|nr:decaprenyl-phosphate phosphoribosyltransferase [bacterium]